MAQNQVAHKHQQQQHQQVQSQHQTQHNIETQEKHAKASASAGLNLNLFGALSGALSSTSRKETHREPDGKEKCVEERDDRAAAQGAAAANGSAFAAADAEDGSRKAKGRGVKQSQGRSEKVEQVDHLGIEG